MDLYLVSIALCLFGYSFCNLILASWNQAKANSLYEQATDMLESASHKEDIVRNGLRKMERGLDANQSRIERIENLRECLVELDEIAEKQVQS